MRILVLNGPNLNLLGKREPDIYGRESLWDLENGLKAKFPALKLEFLQSNHEGALIDALNKCMDGMMDGIVINPGALTHYSYAIQDAIAALKVPVVEVHISNIHAREDFRKNSVTAHVCAAVFAGAGLMGYELAIRYLVENKDR